jgi:hypothetical protein
MRPTYIALVVLFSFVQQAAAADADYLFEVKPILLGRCASCHGAMHQKARLRLDAASLIRKGGRNGPVVVPGKADQSLLIDAVRARDHARMPPEKDGEALSEKDIATLEAWINQGARAPNEPIPPDPRLHWAFRPPVEARVPPGGEGNPIDAFLVAQRDKVALRPNPAADKSTLLRRVYLDLLGLPPTRGELHAFLADSSPDAYEKVVDRLLGNPQYGERWARHWMDVWRYSDPFGFAEEYRYSHRHIWRWRDWIIDALNTDKGLDRMIIEMLAGDELAPTDPDTLRATGFLARNWYKFNRNAWLQDTVEHTAAGFMGITLRCARCHDHKYDPIAQEEYYRFRAFFEPHDVRIDTLSGQPDPLKDGVARAFDANPAAATHLYVRGDERSPDSSRALRPGVPAVLGANPDVRAIVFSGPALLPALGPAVEAARGKARAGLQAAESAAKAANKELADSMRLLEELRAGGPPPKPRAAPAFLSDTFAAARPDVWKVVSGNWAWEKGRLAQQVASPFATLVTLKKHPQDLMGRVRFKTTGGNTTSVGFAFDVVDSAAWQAVYTYCQQNNSAVQAFHRINGAEVYPPEGVVPCPLRLGEVITLDFAVRGTLLNVWVNGKLKIVYNLPVPRQAGTFALWNHNALSEFFEVRLAELPASARLAQSKGEHLPVLQVGPLVVTAAESKRAIQAARAAAEAASRRLEAARAEIAAVVAKAKAEQARCSETPPANLKDLCLAAGRAERTVALYLAQADLAEAEAATIESKMLSAARAKLTSARAALEKPDTAFTPLLKLNPASSTGRRLALARWLASADNPLTARVAVNHIWMRHFGKPLVPTVANFGLSGKPPTHPVLLDWLAARFMQDGWSMKRLHRLLVTSQAYRMSSQADNNCMILDPENRYLWRMNPRRMEAEVVRDSVLAAAGQLSTARGGPPLDEKLGQTSHRRSVYFRFNTEYKMAFLEQFDAASPNECYERRESVVPQQALALCNSALALNQSRRLAKALAADAEDDFLTAAFEQVLGRVPTAQERHRCERFLRDQAALLSAPARLTPFPARPDSVGPAAPDPLSRAREDLIHVLFNHNDFVTVR